MEIPIRFIHTADSHIGFKAYTQTDVNGVNQREMDAMQIFKDTIDYAIIHKPHFILHAGDVFHSINPNNRAMSFVLHQFQRLENAKIHIYIAAGNHETPKRSETGHVFEAFDIFDFVHTSYPYESQNAPMIRGVMNTQQLDELNVAIYMLPFCINQNQLTECIDLIQEEGALAKTNILVTHGTTRNIKEFKKNEFNEQDLPDSLLKNNKFNYIALGHYHNHTKITDIATYSGSTFPLTFGEATDPKGIVEVMIEPNNTLTQVFMPFYSRPVILLKTIDASNLTSAQLQTKIISTLTSSEYISKNPVARLQITNISPAMHKGLDITAIRNNSSQYLHCDIQYSFTTDTSTDIESSEIGLLKDELTDYLNINVIGPNKQIITQTAIDYLQGVSQ